jgi:predicted DNA-binding transcriptional regulator YafY
MPAPLLERFQRLALFHNALALAHTDGKRGVETADLLAEMGCERGVLYRLADDLRGFGAPLAYVDAEHLWRYERTWNLPFSVTETLQGSMGIRMALDFLLDPALEKGLRGRLAVDPQLRKSSSATLPRLTGIVSSPHLLARLARALKERRRVRFSYRKPNETTGGIREVEPLELFEWDGMPYLQAHDPKSPVAFKRYALSRMANIEVLDATFRPPPRKQIPSCLGAFLKTPFAARIHADPAHAPYVRERRWHPAQRNFERKDGGVEFTLPFGDTGEAARWILGRGPGFAPVGPVSLVQDWKAMVRTLADKI